MATLVYGGYKSLIQGVSQQAPEERANGQNEEVINMSSDAEKGLMRRPPTLTVGRVSNLDALYEKVEIDSVEYIFELLSNGTMMLYEEDGTAHRVLHEPNVADYLGGTDRISTLSFDGSVHIVNPNMKVKMEKDCLQQF